MRRLGSGRALPAISMTQPATQSASSRSALARLTVEEIDHMVGTLREDNSVNAVVEAPPSLASLQMLIAHRVAAGLEVKFDVTGPQQPLGAAADQAAYRIIQEALTNAARHGRGSANIKLAFGEAAVELT